jgi:hypothetical protein
MSALTEWQNFYVIVGSSAGALIGLQFVVLTLVAGLPGTQTRGGEAFVTPTIVHFGTALFMAGVMSVPWHQLTPVIVIWALAGLLGILYAVITTVQVRKQSVYTPEFEDWLFHAILPLLAYATLFAAACTASSFERPALFAVGAAALFLLFIGIHNAWDAVIYHVFIKEEQKKQ